MIFAVGPTDIWKMENSIDAFSDIYVQILTILLDAFTEYSNRIQFIFFSTASVYGECNSVKSETDGLDPLSNYAKSMQGAEIYLESISENSHHSFVVFRLTSLYNNSLTTRVLGKIKLSLSDNKSLELYGDGNETRDFLHSSDLLRAIISVLSSNQDFEIYNVGSGSSTSVSKIIDIGRDSNRYFKSLVVFNGIRNKFEPVNMKVNIEKITKLEFEPLIPPELGLAKYFGVEH